jgi:Tol biopolymer transport system component
LLAQSFDPDKGKLSGEPHIVAKGVMNDAATWHMDASAASNGLLVFGSGTSADLQLVWMDRASKQITPIGDKFVNLQLAKLSPQGDRVALQIDAGINDVWVLDLARNVRTRLTFGPVSNTIPVWSPDGKWIAYTANRSEGGASGYSICRKRSDGSGAEETLISDAELLNASDWSPDGKHLIYARRMAIGHNELWDLALEGERKPSLLLRQGNAGHLSPDGRWLAYQSNESGTVQAYVIAYGAGQGKWQVSSNAANPNDAPLWSKDGKELFYIDSTYNIFSVPVKEVSGALQFGAPQVVISNWSAPQVFYDVTPDSKKILLDRVSQQVSQSITVVTNFAAGLKN